MKIELSERSGLSTKDAEERLKKYGYNKIKEDKKFKDIELLINQFKSPYILLLFFTALLLAILGEKIDAFIIISIILLGGLLDFWQERGAYKTIEKLLSMVKTYVAVIRDGKEMEIPIEYVVPGDIVILRAGDMIPADGVVIKVKDLFVNESLMTGEAYPVEKFEGSNLFMGTHVISGFGVMEVIKTGKDTEYGKIVDRLRLGKGRTDGIGITPVLLPAVISVGHSYGARYMAHKGAIVKRLASIENFGSMNVLCCDKTGTLTEGKMKVFAFKN
jgi:Mg2+-importing ATPase